MPSRFTRSGSRKRKGRREKERKEKKGKNRREKRGSLSPLLKPSISSKEFAMGKKKKKRENSEGMNLPPLLDL